MTCERFLSKNLEFDLPASFGCCLLYTSQHDEPVFDVQIFVFAVGVGGHRRGQHVGRKRDADGKMAVGVVSVRPHKNAALLKLDGVLTIEEAEKYRGRVLYFCLLYTSRCV